MKKTELNGRPGFMYFPEEMNTGVFIYENRYEFHGKQYLKLRIHDLIREKRGQKRTYYRRRKVTDRDIRDYGNKVTNHLDIPCREDYILESMDMLRTAYEEATGKKLPVWKIFKDVSPEEKTKEKFKEEGITEEECLI